MAVEVIEVGDRIIVEVVVEVGDKLMLEVREEAVEGDKSMVDVLMTTELKCKLHKDRSCRWMSWRNN